MNEQKHHPFSPSRLEQFRHCSGAYWMQKGLAGSESAYAAEGHLLHERVASGNLEDLTDAQVEVVKSCWLFITNIENISHFEHEVPLSIKDENGESLTEGTADVVIKHSNGDLSIIDWKFGWIPVKAAHENIQLATYAIGAMQKYGKSSCTVYVFQPRINHVSKYTFTKPDAIIANIKAIIEKAKKDVLVLNAGESQCRYCLARLFCPAFRVKFQHLAAVKEDYDLSNPKHLESLYEATKAVKDAIKEIEEATKKYILDNGRCGNYVIEEKGGSRQLGDAGLLYDRIKDWLTPREFSSVCSVGIGKFEPLCMKKIIAEYESKGEKITKDKAKEMLFTVIGDLVTRGKPSQSIVRVENA